MCVAARGRQVTARTPAARGRGESGAILVTIRSIARACALAAGLVASGEPATAGAWTRAAGTGFVSASARYFRTDSDGGTFEKAGAANYLEYGVTDRITLGGSLEVEQELGVEQDAMIPAATLSGFGRLRVWRGDRGDVASVALGASAPAGDAVGLPAQIAPEPEVDLRALYGRGFSTSEGDAFVDAQAGLRLRLEDSADEIRLDLTAGLRPLPRLLLMIQSFNTIGLRNPDGPAGDDFDVFKLAPSVGVEVFDDVTVLLGVTREVGGRNIEPGTTARVAVWTTF